ncbi:unnamed protein product [Ixodes persulcatus]
MIVYLCIVLHERIQNFLVAGNHSNILIFALKYRHTFITIHLFKVQTTSANQFHQLLGFVILQLLCSISKPTYSLDLYSKIRHKTTFHEAVEMAYLSNLGRSLVKTAYDMLGHSYKLL